MTFEEASVLPSSEKITLVTCEAVQPVKLFDLFAPSVYVKNVDYFVSDIKINGASNEQASSIENLSPATPWFYDVINKKLYFTWLEDPKKLNISLVYRFFFSNKPLILSHDLANGPDIEWLPIIQSVGSIGQQLDDENTGIVLESQSQIDFINNHGFFDDKFDRLIWENQKVSFYYWFDGLSKSEIKKIFSGVIESKDFQPEKVTFKVKDFVFRLKNKVKLNLFSSNDGTTPSSIIGTPKRRIYGRANKVKCVPIDATLEGFQLTGTVSIQDKANLLDGTCSAVYIDNNLTGTVTGAINSNTLTGTGTAFTTQLSVNDKIRVTNGLAEYTFTVVSIASATSITVSPKVSVAFTSFTAKNYSKGNKKVYGSGTKFLSQIQAGSKIRFTNGVTSYDYSVEFINNDFEITLDKFIEATFSNFNARNLEIKNNILKGVGTDFLNELTPEDEIFIQTESGEKKFVIESVDSGTEAKLVEEADVAIINLLAKVKPKIPYRQKNRKWHIAGHRLRASIAFITSVINARTFEVDDSSEFSEGDIVTINSQSTQITRVSENKIILEQNLGSVPNIGDSIVRAPIVEVYFGKNNLVFGRDASVLMTENDSILVLDPKSEFNISKEITSSISLYFEKDSRVVTTQAVVDLRTIIKPRDWIRRINQSDANKWFEVLFVTQQSIILRSEYSEFSGTSNAVIKNLEIINDDSLILVDCYGKDSGDESTTGTWITTASDAVKDLVKNDAGFGEIDYQSFNQAKLDCDYLLSMVIPESIGDESPLIRDVITKINESVFGSLYGNSAQEICFSIVNTRRPENILRIKDDDIISFSVQSSQKIVNKIKVNYAPFVDNINGSNGFKTIEFDSSFVNQNIGIENTVEKTCYLFNESDAETIAQRLSFYNSLSQSALVIKAKSNFMTNSVNDRCLIDLERMYSRFGGLTNGKIGLVTGIKKNSYETEIIVSDLGNIFNRCLGIAPDSQPYFLGSEEDDKIKYCFIVDDDTLTPNPSSEEGLGSNIIG